MTTQPVTADQARRLRDIQQREVLPRTSAPFPLALQIAVDRLVGQARALLNSPEMRAPLTAESVDVFPPFTKKLINEILAIATMFPESSVHVSEGLQRVACKLQKRAARCQTEMKPDRSLKGTAQGHFAIVGEFASASAYAQKHRDTALQRMRERDALTDLQVLTDAVGELLTTAEVGIGGEWRRAFDEVVRDLASLVVLDRPHDANTFALLRAGLHRSIDSDLAPAVQASRDSDGEIPRAGSWLSALMIVMECCYEHLTRRHASTITGSPSLNGRTEDDFTDPWDNPKVTPESIKAFEASGFDREPDWRI